MRDKFDQLGDKFDFFALEGLSSRYLRYWTKSHTCTTTLDASVFSWTFYSKENMTFLRKVNSQNSQNFAESEGENKTGLRKNWNSRKNDISHQRPKLRETKWKQGIGRPTPRMTTRTKRLKATFWVSKTPIWIKNKKNKETPSQIMGKKKFSKRGRNKVIKNKKRCGPTFSLKKPEYD